mgnify:CR=1 FL=1
MRKTGWLLLVLLVAAAALIAGCDGGDNGNGGTFDATAWDGTWTGQWVNQTFNSTGAAEFVIQTDLVDQEVDVQADLDGAVFGRADPDPINMHVQYTDSGIDATVDGTNLGDLSFTIGPNGNMQGSFTNVPNAAIDTVTFTGQRSGNTITINYTVNFAGGGNPAHGVVTVTRQ